MNIDFPPVILKEIQINIMGLLNEKGYHKALMFKNGLLATSITLRNYDAMKLEFIEAFLTSYITGKPPVFKFKWDFGEHTTCMRLKESMCEIDGSLCTYYKQKRFPLCEHVNKSIVGASKRG